MDRKEKIGDRHGRAGGLSPWYWSAALAIAAFCPLTACHSREAVIPEAGKVGKVILISIDTLRADHLGAYGYSRPTSPTLDALAAQGARFTNCVAVSPWTLPSHVSMFTGLYPSHNGVTGTGTELKRHVRTLVDLLSQRDFATGAVIAADLVLPCRRCRSGFDSVTYFEWKAEPGSEGPSILDTGEDVTEAAIRWLDKNGEHDFFLFLHYYDLHSDYAPKETFARAVGAKMENPQAGSHEYLLRHRDTGNLRPEEVEQAAALYDGEIRKVDSLLKEVLAFVKRRGWWDKTLIVVTSDHGEEFQEHGGLLHGRKMYEELLHVPLIIKGPGIPAGKVVPAVVQHTDIAPTILAATGTPLPEGLDGRSLLELVAGRERSWKNQAVAEADHFHRKQMARAESLKLIVDRSGAVELYDLESDPAEQTNLAAARPTAVARLKRLLPELLGAATNPAPARPLSPRERQRLQALGYLK